MKRYIFILALALGTFITSWAQDVQSVQDSASLVGLVDGLPVRMELMLPVTFKLPLMYDTITYEVVSKYGETERKRAFQHPNFVVDSLSTGQDWATFLYKNMRYPREAVDYNIEGRVIVQFVVEKTGKLTEVEVIKGVHPSLDAEAVRLVQSMPKWEAGRCLGSKVRVRTTMPVEFNVSGWKMAHEIANHEDTIYDKRFFGSTCHITYFGDVVIRCPYRVSTFNERIFFRDEIVSKEKYVIPKELSEYTYGRNHGAEIPRHLMNKAEFPDGNKALCEYLYTHIKYPSVAVDNGAYGRVNVRFTINKDGMVVDPKVMSCVDPSLCKAALRVITAMPKWKPATYKGSTLRTFCSIDIVFERSGYEKIFWTDEVDVEPSFQGGDKALMDYVSAKIELPEDVKRNVTQGEMDVLLGIDTDGSITKCHVLGTCIIYQAFEKASAEQEERWNNQVANGISYVLESMPKWIPGRQKGKNVRVIRNVTIKVKLNERKENLPAFDVKWLGHPLM